MVVVMIPSNILQFQYFWDFNKRLWAIFFQKFWKFLAISFGWGCYDSKFLKIIISSKSSKSHLLIKVLYRPIWFNLFFFFFFFQDFLSWTLMTHRTAEEGRGPSFIPLYHSTIHSWTFRHLFCNFAREMTIMYF